MRTDAIKKTVQARASARTPTERESARRLAALGGIAPDFPDIPRRKVSNNRPRRRKRLD